MVEHDSIKPPRFTKRVRDLTGKVFGRLTVVAFAGRNSRSNLLWLCKCECGNSAKVSSGNLNRGTGSCGCLVIDRTIAANTTHGRAWSGEYESWAQMKQRCTSPNNGAYDRYGGRGITICNRWLTSFEAFFADMGEKPTPSHSLDRINNDGNYEPGNCRWADDSQQIRNRRNTIQLTLNGETMSAADWAARLDIPIGRIHMRIKYGFSVERILDPRNFRARKNQTNG